MKKIQNALRSRLLRYSLMGVLAAVFVFTACRKDRDISGEFGDWTADAPQDAKTWFEQYQKDHNTIFKLSDSLSGKIDPLWDKAKVFGEKTEVPFHVNKKFIIPRITAGLKGMGVSHLVFTKKSNGYAAFIYMFAPAPYFKGDIQKVSFSTYKEHKFSGIMRIHDIRGKRVSGFAIENGRITTKLSSQSSNGQKATSRMPCYDVTISNCGQVCVGGFCSEWYCDYSFTQTDCPSGGGGEDPPPTECQGECECFPSSCDPCADNPGSCDGSGGGGGIDPPPCNDCSCNPSLCPKDECRPCTFIGLSTADLGHVLYGAEDEYQSDQGLIFYYANIEVTDCPGQIYTNSRLSYSIYQNSKKRPFQYKSYNHELDLGPALPKNPESTRCGFKVIAHGQAEYDVTYRTILYGNVTESYSFSGEGNFDIY